MVVMHPLGTGHCDGWSETLSDRLVNGFETLPVQSSARVAGFWEVWQSSVRRGLDLWC